MSNQFSDSCLNKALQLAKNLNHSYDKIHTLIQIADSYEQFNQKDKAFDVISESLKEAENINSTEIKANCLNLISHKYIKFGLKEQAFQILSQEVQIV